MVLGNGNAVLPGKNSAVRGLRGGNCVDDAVDVVAYPRCPAFLPLSLLVCDATAERRVAEVGCCDMHL